MTDDKLHAYWEHYILECTEISYSEKLKDLFQSCLGERDGGIRFVCTELGEQHFESDKVTLEVRSWNLEDRTGDCYLKVKDTGDDAKDWEYAGCLVEDPSNPPPHSLELDFD